MFLGGRNMGQIRGAEPGSNLGVPDRFLGGRKLRFLGGRNMV